MVVLGLEKLYPKRGFPCSKTESLAAKLYIDRVIDGTLDRRSCGTVFR